MNTRFQYDILADGSVGAYKDADGDWIEHHKQPIVKKTDNVLNSDKNVQVSDTTEDDSSNGADNQTNNTEGVTDGDLKNIESILKENQRLKQENEQLKEMITEDQRAHVSGSANDLQLYDKRTNVVSHMCEMFASGEYTLREILFAMCYLAEAHYE